MRFVDFSEVARRFAGKRVAIVGSAPSCLENEPGEVDARGVVVRVNNYKTGPRQGYRCDVHYSFYGTSIRCDREDLIRDGVTLCICKCPDSKPIDSPWHELHGKREGVDYRYIYNNRSAWWFCDTFVPGDERFLKKFELLGRHQPTTGFAAILDVVECEPKEIYLTGFDFFTSRIHNVNEPWREGRADDPIRHRPDLELAWIKNNAAHFHITLDAMLTKLVAN